MWHTLLSIAMKQQNLTLAERCFSALGLVPHLCFPNAFSNGRDFAGDVGSAHFLQETISLGRQFMEENKENPSNSPQIWARLSILYGDLSTAENIYLEQGDIEAALDMYKKLHKWDDVLRYVDLNLLFTYFLCPVLLCV